MITSSSIVRVAGNIASGYMASSREWTRTINEKDLKLVAELSVKLAYLIVAEVERCEPYRGETAKET